MNWHSPEFIESLWDVLEETLQSCYILALLIQDLDQKVWTQRRQFMCENDSSCSLRTIIFEQFEPYES